MNIPDATYNKHTNFIYLPLFAVFIMAASLLTITGCNKKPSNVEMEQAIKTANAKIFGITDSLTEILDFQKITLANLENKKLKGVSAWKVFASMEKKNGMYYSIYLISKTPKLGLSVYREPYNAKVSPLGDFTTDIQVKSRFDHIYAINIDQPDAVTKLWVRERYTYPRDLSAEKLPITAVNGESLTTNLKIDVKVEDVIAVWDSTKKEAKISDLMSGKNVTIKKGDKPVEFRHYGSFETGRILEFVVK